jgi:hypothetical protein
LNSRAAISALQGLLRENVSVAKTILINIEYTKTFTLEKFERYMGNACMTLNLNLDVNPGLVS